MPIHHPPTDDTLIRASVVQARTSLSRTTIWRMAGRGEFPSPVRIGSGRVAWSASAVGDWIAAKVGSK